MKKHKKKNKEMDIRSDQSLQSKKHPVRQQLSAVLLCFCLIMVSLPVENYSFPVLAAQGYEEAQREILSFSGLPGEVSVQTVSAGTPLENLSLPDTLTVVYRSFGEEDPEKGQEPASVEAAGGSEGEPISAEVDNPGESNGENSAAGLKGDVTENAEDPVETGQPENAGNETSEPEPSEAVGDEAGGSEGEPSETVENETGEPEPSEAVGNEAGGLEGEPSETVENETGEPETEVETETAAIDGVTWTSVPEYDGETKGSYVFTPVLPEHYTLAEGVKLPEVTVTVEESETKEKKESQETKEAEEKKARNGRIKKTAAEEIKIEEKPVLASVSIPKCGIISADTVWTEGSLSTGELIVKPGVTLTINGEVEIKGTVTIKGGGTILRGNGTAGFLVKPGTSMTMGDIVVDGNSKASSCRLIDMGNGGKVILDDGCVIRNCVSSSTKGVIIYVNNHGVVTLNDATIENCSTGSDGGLIWAVSSTVTVNGGTYQYNKSTKKVAPTDSGAGCVFVNTGSKLTVNGGRFIGNTSASKGGVIYHSGASDTKTYVYGGYFQGNTCTYPGMEGSGAIFCSSVNNQATIFNMSGNVRFCGDGNPASGTDGIYLDMQNATPRMVQISNTLSYPVNIYLKASEGYVIAQGVNDYILLHERDMKKINFIDIGDSGEKWYAVLDESNNQVQLSTVDPGYGYYVYYISNGAKGTVTDNNRYAIGDTATIQSAEKLSREGYHFLEWNTEPDGSGTSYQEGDTMEITGDTDLYAVFEEEGRKTFAADFYSGEAGYKETKAVTIGIDDVSGMVTSPELAVLDGWTAVGWDKDTSGYAGEIPAGSEITLTDNISYYGIYKKEVTLSYDANGGESDLRSETKTCYANVHSEITYQYPEFTLALAPSRSRCTFTGWNTKADGTGAAYAAGSRQEFDKDTTLYAIWDDNTAAYQVEHYKQNLEGDGYTRVDSDTEKLTGTIDDTVTAEAKTYPGFTENTSCEGRKISGKVAADGNLVLKLYYDREVYEVSFHLNGGTGNTPGTQKVRYGGLLQEVEIPVRAGYNFKGWYTDKKGTDGSQWDFGRTVDENTVSRRITLYAKWADETAPVLGKASYETGYKDLFSWVISKKCQIITIPITEEGSGVKQAEYTLIPEGGTAVTELAQIEKRGTVLDSIRAQGKNDITAEAGENTGENAKAAAKIIITNDFKGTVSLVCSDHAGNISARKVLTAENGGIIVEDNAPEITFSTVGGVANGRTAVEVFVEDDKDDSISGGIASVSYHVDDGEEKTVAEKKFNSGIVEACRFTVDISDPGKHILRVSAEDNAGNENSQQITVNIDQQKESIAEKPTGGEPIGGEPGTGESIHVEIYATLAMIAGFTYLLLYFMTREHGMTERKKEELVYRMIRWGRGGGRIRKTLALAAIFLLLAYYHSIGRRIAVEMEDSLWQVRKNIGL